MGLYNENVFTKCSAMWLSLVRSNSRLYRQLGCDVFEPQFDETLENEKVKSQLPLSSLMACSLFRTKGCYSGSSPNTA